MRLNRDVLPLFHPSTLSFIMLHFAFKKMTSELINGEERGQKRGMGQSVLLYWGIHCWRKWLWNNRGMPLSKVYRRHFDPKSQRHWLKNALTHVLRGPEWFSEAIASPCSKNAFKCIASVKWGQITCGKNGTEACLSCFRVISTVLWIRKLQTYTQSWISSFLSRPFRPLSRPIQRLRFFTA